MSYYYLQTSNDHLEHHGVLGMRWGIRRYQPYAKGSKGGKEVGLAAKKSKVKVAGEKIKSVVKSKQFQNAMAVAIPVVAMGTAAAAGTAFITSPIGQDLFRTSIATGAKLISDAKAYLNDKAWDAANSWNKWIDEKLGVDYAKTDRSLLELDRKIKQDDKIQTAALDSSVRTLKADVKVADAIMMKALEKNEAMVDKIQNDPETQEALARSLEKLTVQYASEKSGLSESDIEKGITMAKNLSR